MSIHEDIERRAKERVGKVLRGKYRLDALLGVGGMGAVYAATHTNNRNRVAVKVLHAEQAVNAQIRQRFSREGYLANTVEHVGAVRVIDDETDEDGSVFLVMELLEGETLDARVHRRGKLPEAEVAEITAHALDVLAAAHAKKIVHRDMKPENVFITNGHVIKVLDFGIARLREEGGATSTQTGQTIGTPAFMAPEQALGETEQIGPATDVWAVGATMFTALSGHFVHDDAAGAGGMQMLIRAATKQARSLATVAPDVSPALVSIVDRALAFDAKDRYAEAGAMRDALRAAFGITIVSGPHLPRISIPDVEESASVPKVDAALAPTLELPPHVVASTTAGLSSAKPDTKGASRMRIVMAGAIVVTLGTVAFFAFRHRPESPSTNAVAEPSTTTPPTIAVASPSTTSVMAPPPDTSTAAVRSTSRPTARPVASRPDAATPAGSVDPLDHQ